MYDHLLALLSGALVAGYLTAGLCFLRFWRTSRDTLFAYFAAAFWLLALQRGLLALGGESFESQTPLYVLRLAAYLLLLGAIVSKNRRERP